MEDKTEGWVIISEIHPITGGKFIMPYTFKRLRKDAIAEFLKGSGATWSYWKTKYNFKAVKATSTIITK